MPDRPTIRRLALLAALACASPAISEPLSAGSDCGGDAFSSARVVEHRPPRHGPLVAMPDTLCADLSPQRPPDMVRVDAYPVIAPQVGTGRGGVPYEGVRPDRARSDRPNLDHPRRDRPPGPFAAPTAFPLDGTADHRRTPPRPE